MDTISKTYQRLIKSSMAEQILSNSKIHINVDTLRPHLIGKHTNKNSDLYKYMKNASQGNGFISTEYDSKQKVTARMFTKKNHLNLITLSDELVLSSINSRYENGKIVVLDYKNFEPSIIRSILGDVIPEDLHQWAAELLEIPRKAIKQINMELMYCNDFSWHIKKVCKNLMVDHDCNDDYLLIYAEDIFNMRKKINTYVFPMIEDYKYNKYVINTYGRKIYPKEQKNIFNNVIQSVGSEILIEAIIELNRFLRGKEAHLLFHRFDALYFDIAKEALFRHLGKIIKIMESVNDSIPLKVGIQLGDNLMSLEELDSG